MPSKSRATTKTPSKPAGKRKLARPQYKSFRISKRLKHPDGPVKGGPRIFWASCRHLGANWKTYGVLLLVYLALSLFFVKGFTASTDLAGIKDGLQELVGSGSLSTGATLFGVLLGSAGSGSGEVGATYQTILLVLMSLVFIWAIRQRFAEHRVGLANSFYKSMYPLIPFLLVLVVIMLQLIPLVIGNALYGTVVGNGLAVTAIEKVLWGLFYFLLALLSLYMISSSIFALYIVTLPDMRPMQALRSARELVRYRRWTVLRKVLFLPLALLVLGFVVMLPVIMWLTPAAEWVFWVLSVACLPLIHTYLYSLYRELL